MNERYLFKAKRINWKELPKEEWWVVGYYFCMWHLDKRTHIHHFIIPLDMDLSKGRKIEEIQVEIDKSTLCACTGLYDKEKRLIWENDVVSVTRENGMVEYAVVEYHTSSTMSGFKMRPLRDWIFTSFNEVEVIGNIFDNPELLEVE